MKSAFKKFIPLLLLVVLLLGLHIFNNSRPIENQNNNNIIVSNEGIKEDGHYTSKEDVALYIHTYNKLPSNYITKSEAGKLGWVAKDGNLWEVSDHLCIGGDYFNNYEGNLPKKKGRQYYECDIDYEGGYRNAKRIVFSNDGLIYYTDDHYETFELLYGEEENE